MRWTDDGLAVAFGVVVICGVAVLVGFFGWGLLVGVPKQAAEKAVCFDRGGFYVIAARDTTDEYVEAGCYQPLVPLTARTPVAASVETP